MAEEATKAAISGAGAGATLGLVPLLFGASKKDAIRSALLAALTGGTVAGSGVGLGTELMGKPEEDEINPYTRRGAVGGGVAGGGLGALTGAALAKKWLRIPGLDKGPVGKLAGMNPAKGAAIGGAAGAAGGAGFASDEAMKLDFVENELRDLERRRKREQMEGIQ